jgi:predicted ribosome quality control (RQC) complex YloA/Tae2 family protein
LEGVFLSAIVEALGSKLNGRRCSGAQVILDDTLSLGFGHEMLLLCARPGNPSVLLRHGGLSSGLPPAAVWNDQLEGALVSGVSQHGLDRVLELEFEPASPYSPSRVRVIFEAAGRNANVILVRSADERILACFRLVTSKQSRYRRVAPGEEYAPPPPSGAPAGRWEEPSIREALGRAVTTADVYSLLEGIGPATAAALMEESGASGMALPDVVAALGRALAERRFAPWMTARGPVPIRLGAGAPIEDALDLPHEEDQGVNSMDAVMERFTARMDAEIAAGGRRISRIRKALEESIPPSVFRNWGSLLLARAHDLRPGSAEVVLSGWEGEEVRIPLRPLRTWQENANRYFRKARNAEMERENLEHLLKMEENRLQGITDALRTARETGTVEPALAPRPGRPRPERSGPIEKLLAPGWRCWIGRNAKGNDEVTFRIGRRGDVWLHARGLSGAHVVLRCESRQTNPPSSILEQAAALAAEHSRSTSEVIPVDYTLVQHVRKARGAGPGEVLYSGEKTLFIRMTSRRGARPRKHDRRVVE